MVVCLGELLIDMVSEVADASLAEAPRFLKAPGGAPANVAVGLARLGIPSEFVGQVGDDPFGGWLRDILSAENVGTAHLSFNRDVRTTIAFVATRRDGAKDICFYRNPGADASLRTKNLAPDLFTGQRIFHCGSVTLSQNPAREAQFEAARRARAAGMLVSFDPNWRPSLWDDHGAASRLIHQMAQLSDIVKVADEEWEFVTGTTDLDEGAAMLRALGPRLIIVTHGSAGAYFNCEGAAGHVEPFAVEAIDSLGAGDAFVAGLLHQVLQHESFESLLGEAQLINAVRFANACGAMATRVRGAIPSLPGIDEIKEFIKTPRR